MRNTVLHIIFFFLASFSFIPNVKAQFFNKEVKAKIKAEKNSEFYTFKAIAENLTPSDYSLRYEFMVFKTDDNNNTTKSSQENRFFLKANDKQILSSVTVNYNVTNKTIIALLIYDKDGKPIGQDRIELAKGGQTELEADPKQLAPVTKDQAAPQDGYVKKGLVFKKTISKAGQDFYRMFYQKYFNLGVTTPHDILITESFARGRTTKIEVLVENQMVWRFFSQPRKKFLQEMSDISFDRAIARLRVLQKQDKQLTKY